MLEKKTVSQCISADYCRGWNDAINEIPDDLLERIQQLEAGIEEWEMVAASPGAVEDMARKNAELLEKIKQLELERDALFELLRTNRNNCNSCKHKPEHKRYGCTSVAKLDGSCWEWRGLCEENGGKVNE